MEGGINNNQTIMKVLVISTSPRIRSNSDALANEFVRGAQDAGHDVEKISLRGKNILFCRGCLTCATNSTAEAFNKGEGGKVCVIKNDDVAEIIQKMHDADVICWATPIYYYEMSGQMKVLIDRGNPLYRSDYHFRDVYMLSTAAEDEPDVPERAVEGLTGWIDCFENAQLKGTVFAGGVTSMDEIEGHPALQKAYKMGKSI